MIHLLLAYNTDKGNLDFNQIAKHNIKNVLVIDLIFNMFAEYEIEQ
jgi:hypothetical protein